MWNLWIICMIVSVFLITVVGFYRRFVTTKLSGKVLIVNRIRLRTVRLMLVVFTSVFAIVFGLDVILFATKHATGLPVFYSILYWGFWIGLIVVMTILYHCMLCFLYNKAVQENDKEIKEELIRLMLERR